MPSTLNEWADLATIMGGIAAFIGVLGGLIIFWLYKVEDAELKTNRAMKISCSKINNGLNRCNKSSWDYLIYLRNTYMIGRITIQSF